MFFFRTGSAAYGTHRVLLSFFCFDVFGPLLTILYALSKEYPISYSKRLFGPDGNE